MAYSKQMAKENREITTRAAAKLKSLGFSKNTIERNIVGQYSGQTWQQIKDLKTWLRAEYPHLSKQRFNSRIASAIQQNLK
jgi:hypothetical protein